jgi:2-polyprenyl-3-methyl-5-hydroxy-6-metoxy-1,4-benzoquinol methylase
MVEIATSKFPDLSFAVGDAEALDLGASFEFIIVPDVIEHLSDVGAMFRSTRKHCGPGTLLIVTSVNPRWAPVLNLAERLKLKMPEGEHRWLAEGELRECANDAGFDIEISLGRILCPKRIPFLAPLLNLTASRYPSLKTLCLTQVLVFSPRNRIIRVSVGT